MIMKHDNTLEKCIYIKKSVMSVLQHLAEYVSMYTSESPLLLLSAVTSKSTPVVGLHWQPVFRLFVVSQGK